VVAAAVVATGAVVAVLSPQAARKVIETKARISKKLNLGDTLPVFIKSSPLISSKLKLARLLFHR
jgi:hypothetical protein